LVTNHIKIHQSKKEAAWILAAKYSQMISGGEGSFLPGNGASQEGALVLRRAYRHLTGKQMPYPLQYFTDKRMRQ
jgi:hypothetical protein